MERRGCIRAGVTGAATQCRLPLIVAVAVGVRRVAGGFVRSFGALMKKETRHHRRVSRPHYGTRYDLRCALGLHGNSLRVNAVPVKGEPHFLVELTRTVSPNELGTQRHGKLKKLPKFYAIGCGRRDVAGYGSGRGRCFGAPKVGRPEVAQAVDDANEWAIGRSQIGRQFRTTAHIEDESVQRWPQTEDLGDGARLHLERYPVVEAHQWLAAGAVQKHLHLARAEE